MGYFHADPVKTYWWQEMSTSIVHCGHRVVARYEVCSDHSRGVTYYTGRSEMIYVPA